MIQIWVSQSGQKGNQGTLDISFVACFTLSPNPKKMRLHLDHAKQQTRYDYPVHGSKICFFSLSTEVGRWTLTPFRPNKAQDLAASTSRMMIALSKSCYVKLQAGRGGDERWIFSLHEEKSDRSRLLLTNVFEYIPYKHIKQLTQNSLEMNIKRPTFTSWTIDRSEFQMVKTYNESSQLTSI